MAKIVTRKKTPTAHKKKTTVTKRLRSILPAKLHRRHQYVLVAALAILLGAIVMRVSLDSTNAASCVTTTLKASKTKSQCAAYAMVLLNYHVDARLYVDGVFGPKTTSAVNTFKQKVGLPADGAVTKDVWSKLCLTRQFLPDEKQRYQPRATALDAGCKVDTKGLPGSKLAEYRVVEPVKTIDGKKMTRSSIIGKASNAKLRLSAVPSAQYGYINDIFFKESTWRPEATNSGNCIGLGQSCPQKDLKNPGGPMVNALAIACPDWQVNTECQMEFFHKYAQDRYFGWAWAYDFRMMNNWW